MTTTVPGGGAAGIIFAFTSECINGKRIDVEGNSVGPAVGLGLKLGLSLSASEYDDGKSNLDPYQLQGEEKFVMAGASLSLLGVGASALQLGEARIFGAGWQPGLDFSAIGEAGRSTVESVREISC